MALVTLEVTGAGTTEWVKVGGLSIPLTMNSDDGDTSFYNNDGETGVGDVQIFNFDDMPDSADRITSHEGFFKAAKRSGATKTVTPAANLGGFGVGANEALTMAGTYVLFSRTDMQTATPSIAQMNAGELRLQHVTGATGDVGWTWTYWEVTFEPKAGGLITFGFQWIPPLLASGLFGNALRSVDGSVLYSAMRKVIGRAKIVPSRHELQQVIDMMTVRPRFVFLGGC
jgi:hypothetical protein